MGRENDIFDDRVADIETAEKVLGDETRRNYLSHWKWIPKKIALEFDYKAPATLLRLLSLDSKPAFNSHHDLRHNVILRLIECYAIEQAMKLLSPEQQAIFINEKLNNKDYLESLKEQDISNRYFTVFNDVIVASSGNKIELKQSTEKPWPYNINFQGQFDFLVWFLNQNRKCVTTVEIKNKVKEYLKLLQNASSYKNKALISLLDNFVNLYEKYKFKGIKLYEEATVEQFEIFYYKHEKIKTSQEPETNESINARFITLYKLLHKISYRNLKKRATKIEINGATKELNMFTWITDTLLDLCKDSLPDNLQPNSLEDALNILLLDKNATHNEFNFSWTFIEQQFVAKITNDDDNPSTEQVHAFQRKLLAGDFIKKSEWIKKRPSSYDANGFDLNAEFNAALALLNIKLNNWQNITKEQITAHMQKAILTCHPHKNRNKTEKELEQHQKQFVEIKLAKKLLIDIKEGKLKINEKDKTKPHEKLNTKSVNTFFKHNSDKITAIAGLITGGILLAALIPTNAVALPVALGIGLGIMALSIIIGVIVGLLNKDTKDTPVAAKHTQG